MILLCGRRVKDDFTERVSLRMVDVNQDVQKCSLPMPEGNLH